MNHNMSSSENRPKLVFFQNRYDDNLPEFLLTHTREHVDCLSMHFDLVLIHDDCDYAQVCDLHQPDLALFESGVNLFTCRKPAVRNVRSDTTIPKLSLLNADAWCETRSGSLAELDQWGIDAVFSISATAPEHLPSIATDLFVWPNFIDPTVYRDYGEHKLIPVLLSGATAEQYPWRRRVYKLIAENYPVLSCPHRGYLSRSSDSQVLHGVRYARTINAAQITPVCGTIAGEVVRKHFEIPGCNTCMVTERTRHIQTAGFEDMVNCIFADEHDILDKLEFLFKHPDRLKEITAAGHQLVHSRHTSKQRDQILQWLKLYKSVQASQRIVQDHAFAPLRLVNAEDSDTAPRPLEVGLHLQLLYEGDMRLFAGDLKGANEHYNASLGYMRRMPETRFRRALCKLYEGDAWGANKDIFELIQYCLSEYRADAPDPVEWSYYILSQLCMGQVGNARHSARMFPHLQHPELNRVRQLMHLLPRHGTGTVSSHSVLPGLARSVHQLPARDEDEWYEELSTLLTSCGQRALLERLCRARIRASENTSSTQSSCGLIGARRILPDGVFRGIRGRSLEMLHPGSLNRRLLLFKLARKVRKLDATIREAFNSSRLYVLGDSPGERHDVR
jgi:hypothetical protein